MVLVMGHHGLKSKRWTEQGNLKGRHKQVQAKQATLTPSEPAPVPEPTPEPVEPAPATGVFGNLFGGGTTPATDEE